MVPSFRLSGDLLVTCPCMFSQVKRKARVLQGINGLIKSREGFGKSAQNTTFEGEAWQAHLESFAERIWFRESLGLV